MSEIVNMNNKVRLLVEQVTTNSTPGERVSFEMMVTFAYAEGFRDGYARGYTEALFEPKENEGNDSEVHQPV